jgi:hypothetical protein
MRVAWLTHQLPSYDGAENGDNLLPGKFPGGAEFSNYNRIRLAPKGVTVEAFHPAFYQRAFEYDKIIVGATDQISDDVLIALADHNPTVVINHPHPHREGNRVLFEKASVVIGCTPRHIKDSVRHYSVKNYAWVLSPIDPTETQVKEKENFALHAARRDWWKGADDAQAYADTNGLELVIMQREPREKVLETMSRAKYFIHLPKILDAEPQACIEAVLSGCRMIVNENVGLASVPNWDNPDHLRELMQTAAEDFWHLALN